MTFFYENAIGQPKFLIKIIQKGLQSQCFIPCFAVLILVLEKKALKVFTMYGYDGNLDQGTRNFCTGFHALTQEGFMQHVVEISPLAFREEAAFKCL